MNESGPHRPGEGSRELAQALALSFRLLRHGLVAVFVIYLLSGAFVVRQYEQVCVLTLGRLPDGPDRILVKPGFRLTWPRPLAEPLAVETERTRTVESDAFWQEPPAPQDPLGAPPAGRPPDLFAYALTGDANIVHTRWALRYRIEDPVTWLFGFADLDRLLRYELDHAVIKASAGLSVDEALRTNLEGFTGAVTGELRARAAALGLGVRVERVDRLAGAPPPAVARAFAAVVEAENERSRVISQARAHAARAVNEAAGQAARIRAEARSYRLRVVSETAADADYFERIHGPYREQPEVLTRTLLGDALVRALAGADARYLLRRGPAGTQELRLLIGPERSPPGGGHQP